MAEHIVYILSGPTHGPVFIGATADLLCRMTQHRSGKVSHAAFRIDRLVHAESYSCSYQAEKRVRALKSSSREWLDALISSKNPAWENLWVQELMPTPIEEAQAA